ncbi:MAG TPA: signal recognition particle-docking protein FtsY, partial [Rhodothermales bacterium]|nr:signal recognition particle-docking protein FtsY [Rhodothermales bacterium]
MALFGFGRNKDDQDKLEAGLEKTRSGFFGKISRAVAGKDTVDDEVLDDLEEALVTSDVGVKTTVDIIGRIEARVAEDKYVTTKELQAL